MSVTSNTKWRGLVIVITIALCLGFFANRSYAEKVTLRFLNCETDKDTMAYLQEIAKEWEAKTGVKVTVETVPEPDSMMKIMASIKAGRPYDICNVMFLSHVIKLASEGHIIPVTPLIDKIGRNDFGPRILFPWHDEIWWMPYDYNFAVMVIRKDLFQKKGLNPPKTWNDLLQAAKALTEDLNGDGKIDRYGIALPVNIGGESSFLTTPFFWGNGVRTFDDKWNVILDSPSMKPKVIESLKYIKELYRYMPPGMISASWGDISTSFTTEKATMVGTAGRLVHIMDRYSPKLLDNYLYIGYPTPDGKKPATCLGYDGWFLTKGNHQKEAMAFLEWLSTEKLIGFLHTVAVHYQPTRYSIYKDPKWRNHPMLNKHWQAMEAMINVMNNAYITSIDTEGPYIDPRAAKIWHANVYPEMMQDVLLKGMDPGKAVDIASEKIRKTIK